MHIDRCRHHRHRRTTLALAAGLLASLAAPAHCQTSADLALVSEYGGRGIALSTRPALQLRVEHDAAAGWYGGVFASPVRVQGRDQGQLVVYGGRAQRVTSTLSWDVGVSRNAFLRDGRLDYHEFYAGLALQRASARLFYSPAYYGQARSLYLDLSGGQPLGDQLRLVGHVGLLRSFGGYDYGGYAVPPGVPAGPAVPGMPGYIGYAGAPRYSADARIALVFDAGDYTMQAGLQTRWRGYLAEFPRASAFTASINRHF